MSAYGSTAGYKAWADARGYTYAGFTDAQIDAARLRASDYIDGQFKRLFPGERANGRDQDREWPRSDAYDREGSLIPSTTVPVEIENATYEGTRRELAQADSLAPDIRPGGGVVTRVKAGSTEVEFANTGSSQPSFTAIRNALAPLILAGAGMGSVTRA